MSETERDGVPKTEAAPETFPPDKRPLTITSAGQSFSAGGHTFGISWLNSRPSSWRIDNVEVSQEEWNKALAKADPNPPEADWWAVRRDGVIRS